MANNYVKCGRCKGTGVVKNIFGLDENCPACNGVGKVRSNSVK